MRHTIAFLFSILLLFPIQIFYSQNAPVTRFGTVLDASAGTISVPVFVSDFENIGAFNLKLTYNDGAITYNGFASHPSFSEMTLTDSGSGTLLAEWNTSGQAVTLLDSTILFEIEFVYISGSTFVIWDDDGTSCEYKNNLLIPLNDTPSNNYYINGYITDHSAPKTYLPFISNAVTGAVDVPVKVDNFWDIGSFSLAFTYDPTVLTYTGNTPNSELSGELTVTDLTSTGGLKKIVITRTSSTSKTLTDESTLVAIHFNYASDFSSSNNYSELNWNTNGVDCEYKDSNSTDLFDLPYNEFYIDGLVAGQLAPKTYLGVFSDAIAGNNITIPLAVYNFENIAAIALAYEYDASVLTYISNSPNSAFGGGMFIGNAVYGDVGTITISYSGPVVSLNDQDLLAEIDFNYLDGTSELKFKTNGYDCVFGDASYNNLWDKPYEEHYINGVVASQIAPVIKADSIGSVRGNQVSIPLKVSDFNNISSFNFTLDYDPGVLSYTNSTPNSVISGTFSDGTTNKGRLQLSWSATTPLSLADGTILAYLNFQFTGGKTILKWYDNGTSCEITAGVSEDVLYDLPKENFYIDGVVDAVNFIWVGNTSTDWNTAANWSNNTVPNSQSIVSIPNTPPVYWPTFSGNFILGNACERIKLADGAEMTVTGDMVINPGHEFINEGSATLKVRGNWKNTGVFVPNTGKVIFTSESGGFIPDGFLPENEVQNYQQTTESASFTAVSGGMSGPTGDNAHSDVPIGFDFTFGGVTYTNARISTNGWISLNLSGQDANANENSRLFFTSDPTAVLAPWWDDLLADGSSNILYLTSGTVPYRIFTVEWKDVVSYSTGATSRLNFQVKLYESTNEIEFCFGSVVAGTHNSSEGASIGIKGTNGGIGDFIEATTATKNTSVTYLSSENDWPLKNYTFTPPPDTVTFYNLKLGENAILNIETNVNIIGNAP